MATPPRGAFRGWSLANAVGDPGVDGSKNGISSPCLLGSPLPSEEAHGDLDVPGGRQRTRRPRGAAGLPTCPGPPPPSPAASRSPGTAEEPALASSGRPIASRGFPSAGARRRVGSRAGSGGASPGGASPRAPGSAWRMRGRPASPLRRAEPRRRRERSGGAVRGERRLGTGGDAQVASPRPRRRAPVGRSWSPEVRTWRRQRQRQQHPGRPARDAPPTAPRRLTAPASARGAPQPGPPRPSPPRCRPAAEPAGPRPARPCGPPRRRRNTA